MKNIRIGNDIKVEWSIFKKGGGVFLLDGLDLIVYIKDKYGCKKIDGFTIAGNVIRWTFKGKDQRRTGIYSLELVINKDEDGMITTDACQFVNLVSCTCDVAGSDDNGVSTETIELRSQLSVGGSSGEGGGSYDDTAIWKAVNNKVDKVIGKGLSTNDYTNAEKQKLAGLKNYDDTKLKEEIAETYASKDYVNEAVANAGGGGGEGCECATPDWSAPEGKKGHILNRTHYKDVEIFENGGLKTNGDGEPISPNYIRFRDEYGHLSDLIIVNDYTDGSYIEGAPLYDEYGDSVEYIYGTLIFQPYNWTIEFTPEGDGIYYVDSVYESLKQLDEEFIPDTIARKQELTELNEVIEDLDVRLASRAEEIATLQENKADKSELTELSAEVGEKQDALVSGQTIKTINGESILGSGDITIQGGGEPSQYIKDASKSADGSTLTLTKKDGSIVSFSPSGGGGGTPSGNDTELLRMLAGNSPHVIWEDIYGKIHLDAGELKVRKGQDDVNFRTTARKIIACSFDTTQTSWSFFFGIMTDTQDSTIEEIYPYAFNDKKVTDFSWAFSCMPKVKDWSFIKYIDTSLCTTLYGVFNRADADEIDISHWDTSNVTSMACENSNFFGYTKNVIGLENWDTSKVTSIKNMFASTGMESISGVSQWDVRKCQNLYSAFGRSTSLKSIDLSKWEIPEGADMGNMFIVCSVLETIGFPNIPSSAKTSNMLNYCYVLKNVYMREGALIYASLNLNESSSLSAASVKVILSHLAETPDDGATITFASSLYSRYTAEDKAEIDTLRESAKANGWTIVNMG